MDEDQLCAKLDAIIEVNQETQQWLKVMALDRVGDSVEEAIGDNFDNRKLYESLDGETPLSELIKDLDIHRRTAYRRLDEWQRIGIVSKVKRGIYDKLASLETFGIDPKSTE